MSRLRAARALLDNATPADLPRLRTALNIEVDSWTQKALRRVIERLTLGATPARIVAFDVENSDLSGIQAQALQVATKRILHEVRPVVQSIERAARKEVGYSFEDSSTMAALRRLSSLLDALQMLGDAAEAPNIAPFDLTELVASQTKLEGFTSDQVLLARSDSVLVVGDSALVGLAFTNVLRNAIEASIQTEEAAVVNWGRNDEAAWISILDSGAGLPPDALSAAYEVGTTSKAEKGNFGFGLPIAEQAMNSLSGHVTLRPRSGTGTVAEVRWPQ